MGAGSGAVSADKSKVNGVPEPIIIRGLVNTQVNAVKPKRFRRAGIAPATNMGRRALPLPLGHAAVRGGDDVADPGEVGCAQAGPAVDRFAPMA
jgi:hypothetical protein